MQQTESNPCFQSFHLEFLVFCHRSLEAVADLHLCHAGLRGRGPVADVGCDGGPLPGAGGLHRLHGHQEGHEHRLAALPGHDPVPLAIESTRVSPILSVQCLLPVFFGVEKHVEFWAAEVLEFNA